MEPETDRNETPARPRLGLEIRRPPTEGLRHGLGILEAALGDRLVPGDGPAGPGGRPELRLCIDDDRCFVLVPDQKSEVLVDFGARTSPRSRPLLWRACGLDQGRTRIVDATAGLGRDTALLLHGLERARGHDGPIPSLTICERDPLLQFLLLGEVLRLRSSIGVRLAGDASDLFESFGPDGENRPEVIYLDPMFEAHRGSALPKQDLQFLRRWCEGPSVDESRALLVRARQLATHRVVVKRGAKDPALLPGTLHVVQGRSSRFDVYGPKVP